MSFLRVLAAFIAAVLTMMVLGVTTQSVFVMVDLGAVGAQIGPGDALGMILDDISGLGPIYAALILIGFAVALPSAALVGRVLPVPRGVVFAGAGVVCMAVMLVLMQEVFFGVQLIAGARSMAGFVAQAVAGGISTYGFTRMTPGPKSKT